MNRVVLTGLGVISPLGHSMAATWDALLEGRSGAAPIAEFDPEALNVRFACEVKDFDPQDFMERKEAKRADRFTQFALIAAAGALDDAGLGDSLPNPTETGVIIGSGIGGIHTFEEQCRTFLEKGPNRVSPFFVPMFIPDIASGSVSIKYGAKGPNYCTVSACASSAHAIGEAYRLIQTGRAEMMIAGGAEAAITALSIAGFSNMKALSTRNDEPKRASRPFDIDRDGFVMGEGSGIVILESLQSAQKRGARIRGEILGYAMSADAHHMTQPAPGGEGARTAMTLCLEDGKIEKERVGYVNTHGTSTPHGDRAEMAAVKDIFGEHSATMIVGSTKSMTGHLLGAAGGLEAAVSTLAIEEGWIPPTINQDNPDPECDLNCAPNVKVEKEIDVALSNSFGFGGHNAALAIGRYRD